MITNGQIIETPSVLEKAWLVRMLRWFR